MIFSDLTALLLRRGPPDLVAAYATMACSTLAYLDPAQYADRLKSALGASSVSRVGGGDNFTPHILIVAGDTHSIVAFEGTRNFYQWATYVANAGFSRWPTGPGQVFRPILDLFTRLRPELVTLLGSDNRLFVAGHSLGGALACMLARLGQDLASPVSVTHTFGAPACVDIDWHTAYRAKTWCLNHPMDPVPLASPTPVPALRIPEGYLPFPLGIVPTETPWLLPQWANLDTGYFTLNREAALATAAIAPWSLSPHNTFRYLADLLNAMSPAQIFATREITLLLEQLHLFEPWP